MNTSQSPTQKKIFKKKVKKKEESPDIKKLNQKVQQQIDKIVRKLPENHPVAMAMRNERTVQLAQQYSRVQVEGRDPVLVDLGLVDEVNKGKHSLLL